MSDHLTEAARHLRAAIDHLMLHDVDDVATYQATVDMMGELRRTRLFYVAKGLESVEPHRHMEFSMAGGPITEYECTDHHD